MLTAHQTISLRRRFPNVEITSGPRGVFLDFPLGSEAHATLIRGELHFGLNARGRECQAALDAREYLREMLAC